MHIVKQATMLHASPCKIYNCSPRWRLLAECKTRMEEGRGEAELQGE